MSDESKEISLKDVLKKIIEWTKYLFSKWLLIGVIVAIGAGLGYLYAYLSKPVYEASISFVLSNNTATSGGLYGLASQFGINLGGGGDDVFEGDNIISLMKSRKMLQQALFKKTPEKISLVNMLAKDLKLDEGWQAQDRTKGAYPFPDDPAKMTMIQDSLFREVYEVVQQKMLDVSKPDKKLSVYAVTAKTGNEEFSYYLTKFVVDVTSKFYIDTKTSVARQNLSMIQNEADSIKRLLGGTITSAAAQTDLTFNLNPAYQVQRSGIQQSQVSAGALGEAYGEVLKNLELAKITLQKETPLYQVIDESTLPLKADKPSKLIMFIAGGFLFGATICCFLIVRRLLLQMK